MPIELAEMLITALQWAVNDARNSGATTVDLTGKMQSIDPVESQAIMAAITAAAQSPAA